MFFDSFSWSDARATGRCREAEESPDSTGQRIRPLRAEGVWQTHAMESGTEKDSPQG